MFKVVLVGRTNTGKSTIFNRLIGKKFSIVSDSPGVTRDYSETSVELYDLKFSLIDTGGYDNVSSLGKSVWDQSVRAVHDADCILFVLDANGLTALDQEIFAWIRTQNKPTITCINKIDLKVAKGNLGDFFTLGLNDMIYLSAAHKQGFDDLYVKLKEFFHTISFADNHQNMEAQKPLMHLAFVGKPNVGKSTIINHILNEQRLLVSEVSGTTRDSVYLDFNYNGHKLKIVDTAGLRKKNRIKLNTIEKQAVSASITAINFATIVFLIISAEYGFTKQDLVIAKHVIEEGRGLIILVNKIDLLPNKMNLYRNIKEQLAAEFFQVKGLYVYAISALQGFDVSRLFNMAFELHEKWNLTVPTSKLNSWLKEVKKNQDTPYVKGKKLKLKYISQAKSRPPTINLWSNYKAEFPDNYLRYLHNEFCKAFDMLGCPIRINICKSMNPYQKKK